MSMLIQKESEMALYIAPREGMIAPLNFADDWTEIRCGAFLVAMDAIQENHNNGQIEQVTVVDASDYVAFGLKNSTSLALPGEADAIFIGVRSTGGISECANFNPAVFPPRDIGRISDNNHHNSAVGYDGLTLVDGGQIRSGQFTDGAIYFPNPEDSSGYCGLFVIKVKISSRGTASQTVSISIAAKALVSGLDYSPFALKQEMNNADFGPEITLAWNTGAAPRDIPDAFYVRLPFYSNRIMLAAMRAIKYQPE